MPTHVSILAKFSYPCKQRGFEILTENLQRNRNENWRSVTHVAAVFIGAVNTILVAIALPRRVDAVVVAARELLDATGRHDGLGGVAVRLVAAVGAVHVAIALP